MLLVCFFSSRRRHTRYWRDWSSDVCSSDLRRKSPSLRRLVAASLGERRDDRHRSVVVTGVDGLLGGCERVRDRVRSEERRVGKSVDLGGRRIIKKKSTYKNTH